MEKTKTENRAINPPKTIRAIVEDLRSRGELDEGRWERFRKEHICFLLFPVIIFSIQSLNVLLYQQKLLIADIVSYASGFLFVAYGIWLHKYAKSLTYADEISPFYDKSYFRLYIVPLFVTYVGYSIIRSNGSSLYSENILVILLGSKIVSVLFLLVAAKFYFFYRKRTYLILLNANYGSKFYTEITQDEWFEHLEVDGQLNSLHASNSHYILRNEVAA